MTANGHVATRAPDVASEIGRALRCPRTGWSLGVEGALAEFSREPREPARLRLAPVAGVYEVGTARGGIRVRPSAAVRPVAYESPSRHAPGWRCGVSFCLPAGEATTSPRAVVTEVGPDRWSLRGEDRGGLLFDLGLGVDHVEACVRTRDPATVDLLRRRCGRALLDGGAALVDALIRASPHRVFRSRLGRIEVYQPIPTDVTPDGPHTHLRPEGAGRGPARARPWHVPAGHVVALEMYPPAPSPSTDWAHASLDGYGHDWFERLLPAWGVPQYLAEKERAAAAMAAGVPADRYRAPPTPVARCAVRVALRQRMYRLGDAEGLRAWRERFDAEPDRDMG